MVLAIGAPEHDCRQRNLDAVKALDVGVDCYADAQPGCNVVDNDRAVRFLAARV